MPSHPDTATRKARIIGLRRVRASWRDIADDVGLSIARALGTAVAVLALLAGLAFVVLLAWAIGIGPY